LAKAVKKSLKE
jgi:hypothetical protein